MIAARSRQALEVAYSPLVWVDQHSATGQSLLRKYWGLWQRTTP
ncbi:MAG: hypothetical protein ACKV2Q_30675 [Planctomycetaceae bacterium]